MLIRLKQNRYDKDMIEIWDAHKSVLYAVTPMDLFCQLNSDNSLHKALQDQSTVIAEITLQKDKGTMNGS